MQDARLVRDPQHSEEESERVSYDSAQDGGRSELVGQDSARCGHHLELATRRKDINPDDGKRSV